MSDAVSYLSEPATAGKLVLHTTIGDLDLELFSQQTPLTCRTFLSLALRHAYDGCTFHRIERDFLAQTGDLATSALPHTRMQRIQTAEWYTTPLKPELHSRLRFNRRGLVGLARSAKPATASAASPAVEDNAQFFITLAAAPELSSTHTLFGKLTGDTLYNLARLNEPDVAAHNSAVRVRINSVELLSCPWPELVDEVESEEREWRAKEEEEERRRKRKEDGSNRLAKRNTNALSFGADEEDAREEQQEVRRKKAKGLHDVLEDGGKLTTGYTSERTTTEVERHQSLPSRSTEAEQRSTAAERDGEDVEDEDDRYEMRMRERVLRDKLISADDKHATSASASAAVDIKQQIQQLTKRLFPATPATAAQSGSAASDTPAVSALEQRKQRFMQQKRQRSDVSAASTDTMAKLAHFRTKLQHAPSTNPTPVTATTEALLEGEEKAVPAADWVTASASLLRDADDDEERRVRQQERAEGIAWMKHKLQFVRRPQDYAEGEDDGLAVFDPTGQEGSREEVRMGKKGLGVESNGRSSGGNRERDRNMRRDERSSRHSGSQSHERLDRRE